MKRLLTLILVSLIMITGILGITNPGFRQPYKLFEKVEGKLAHNYFIFSVYQQDYGYTQTDNGKYFVHRRFIGIALNFYEISPLREERE